MATQRQSVRGSSALSCGGFGCAVAVLASGAAAAVVTQPLSVPLNNGAGPGLPGTQVWPLDFNADSVNDFSFTHTTTPVALPKGADYNGTLTLDAATVSQFLQVVKDTDTLLPDAVTVNPLGDYAELLGAGMVVGPGNTFISLSDLTYDNRLLDSSGTGNGGALSVASGEMTPGADPVYIGFAFGNIANPNYGYIELSSVWNDDVDGFLTGDTDVNDATLTGFAYETTPGVPILIVQVPEPVGLLPLGLAAALVRRRRGRLPA